MDLFPISFLVRDHETAADVCIWDHRIFGRPFISQKSMACKSQPKVRLLIECIYGGLATLVIYGLIMDASSVLNFSNAFSWEMLLAKIISGVPFNLIHAISTVFFLWVLAMPMEKKLNRIKKKYGILKA